MNHYTKLHIDLITAEQAVIMRHELLTEIEKGLLSFDSYSEELKYIEDRIQNDLPFSIICDGSERPLGEYYSTNAEAESRISELEVDFGRGSFYVDHK